MKAIETTGLFDDKGVLRIQFPLSIKNRKVKLIILIPEEEDIEGEEWLSAIDNNEAFDFLHDPEEDIYTQSSLPPQYLYL